MNWKFPYRSISQLHAAYESGQATPTSVVQFFLKQIDASKHNAFITVLKDRALACAKQQDQELKANGNKIPKNRALFGVPMGIKDVLCMDGVRTTAASKMLDNYVAPYTATAVKRLEDAGIIVLGKLNMDEFAMGSSNENSAYGPVVHPTHSDRVPGGSSGGSGSAVAAELCFAALGTDTGGSIRLPASFCGIFGMKPTYGRISRYGMIAFASSLDQIGPMTRSAQDGALILETMAGFDPADATSVQDSVEGWSASVTEGKNLSSMKGLRVGIPKEYFIDGIDPEVRNAVEDTLKKLESAGAKLIPVSLPHTQYAVATYYVVAVSEASSNLSRFDGVRFGVRPQGATEATSMVEFYKKVRSNFGAEVKRRIILGTFALSAGYYEAYYKKACQVRRLIRNDFEDAFKTVDVIASPISPTTAFKVGSKTTDPLQMYLMDIFTIPASLGGFPALSVPCGKDKDGLSVGFHLIGPRYKEQNILKVASAVETMTGEQT